MTAAVLCGFVFVVAFLAARRSLLAGVVTVLTVGYGYGIARANLGTPGHFLFDAAVLGFYLARLRPRWTRAQRAALAPLSRWVAVLIAWPLLLAAFPLQDPFVH